jgi:anaphase-promoting complex subunit 11
LSSDPSGINAQSPPLAAPHRRKSAASACFGAVDVFSILSTRQPRNLTFQATRDTMKVTIREWNAVAAWRWDMPDDDVCGICRNPYDSTCSKCKFPGDECPLCMFCNDEVWYGLTWGDSTGRMQPLLSHGTPLLIKSSCTLSTNTSQHCIFSWLKQESSLEKCPMCRQRMYEIELLDCPLICIPSLQVQESRRADCHRNPGTDPRTRHEPAIAFAS